MFEPLMKTGRSLNEVSDEGKLNWYIVLVDVIVVVTLRRTCSMARFLLSLYMVSCDVIFACR
jgi:hypothetical protein